MTEQLISMEKSHDDQRLAQSHLKSKVRSPGGVVHLISNVSLYCTHTGDPTDSDSGPGRMQNPAASH